MPSRCLASVKEAARQRRLPYWFCGRSAQGQIHPWQAPGGEDIQVAPDGEDIQMAPDGENIQVTPDGEDKVAPPVPAHVPMAIVGGSIRVAKAA